VLPEKISTGGLWAALEQSGALTNKALLLPAEVSEDELEGIARMFGGVKSTSSFVLGDLFLYTQTVYGDDAVARMEEATGLAHQTCENMLSICRRIKPSVRRDVTELHFSTQAVVAPLTPNEQRHWLSEAVKHGWTRQQLRDEIFGAKVLPPAVNGNLPDVVKDALAGAREMMDGWLISRDSYTRLTAALHGGVEDGGAD
jgi:hypothetical protein